MLQVFLSVLLLTSCSLSTSRGGKKNYMYQSGEDYQLEKLAELAPKVIETSQRNPTVGTLEKLFSREQADIKRIGIIVFETKIQETRSGLASAEGRIYPTAAGKQIITEKFLNIWEEALPIIDPALDLVASEEIKNSRKLHESGVSVDDHVKTSRVELGRGDIKFMEKGKRTATETVLNPRGMRDFSLLLVPAAELMNGPKWSQHQKHMLNDVAKELNLDAVLVIMSQASWQNSQEMTVSITASTLIPFSRYHERLEKLGTRERPDITVAYRTYEGSLNAPITMVQDQKDLSFSEIQKKLLDPLFSTYRDLALMTMIQMREDWEKTR